MTLVFEPPSTPAIPRPPSAVDYRSLFPLLDRCVYMNSNSTGAMPRALVLDEYRRTSGQRRDEVWREWWSHLGTHANEIAALIGATPGSVACHTRVATLLSRVMSCFDFRCRPRVVTSELEFPAVPLVLRAFARHGASLTVVTGGDGIAIDEEQIAHAIDERTQLVYVSHATYATGALLDVAPILRRARAVGALVALGACQSAGVVPIDVRALDVDFVLGSSHTWLCGARGSAFLYVRPSLAQSLQPAAPDASDDPPPIDGRSPWAGNVRRFAGGTRAVLPSRLSRPGLAIVREIGVETIRALSLARTDHVIARADEARLAVATPRADGRRGGIVTVRFPGDADVARTLVAHGFVCSYRGGIRIAPHFYNTDEEVDRFMNELVRLARVAK